MRRAKARLCSLTREFNGRYEKTNEKEEREVPSRCTLASVCVCSLTAHIHVTRVAMGTGFKSLRIHGGTAESTNKSGVYGRAAL